MPNLENETTEEEVKPRVKITWIKPGKSKTEAITNDTPASIAEAERLGWERKEAPKKEAKKPAKKKGDK